MLSIVTYKLRSEINVKTNIETNIDIYMVLCYLPGVFVFLGKRLIVTIAAILLLLCRGIQYKYESIFMNKKFFNNDR